MNTISRFYRQVLGFFPSRLPQGVEEFTAWVESIRETYTLPTLDSDSISFVLANMIMALGPREHRKAKWFFVQSLRAAAAKQIASHAFQSIKARQKADAQAAANKSEAATPSSGSQSVQIHQS
jgi:hypothetical protein